MLIEPAFATAIWLDEVEVVVDVEPLSLLVPIKKPPPGETPPPPPLGKPQPPLLMIDGGAGLVIGACWLCWLCCVAEGVCAATKAL